MTKWFAKKLESFNFNNQSTRLVLDKGIRVIGGRTDNGDVYSNNERLKLLIWVFQIMPKDIKYLNITTYDLENKDIYLLLSKLKFCKEIESLQIEACGLNDIDAKLIANFIKIKKNPKLVNLNLRDNEIGDKVLKNIIKSLKGSDINNVNLEGNYIKNFPISELKKIKKQDIDLYLDSNYLLPSMVKKLSWLPEEIYPSIFINCENQACIIRDYEQGLVGAESSVRSDDS